MALVSTINIDLGSQTAILNASIGSGSVDVITYDNTTRQVTFDSRPEIFLTFFEFLSFCDQINNLQTAILYNYSPYISATTPNIVEYQSTASSLKFIMLDRASSKILAFPEWVYFLAALNHYRISIKGF